MISFAEKHPELVPEWSEENEQKPGEVSYGSNKKILWNGACGHRWEATVKNRGNGSGCPFCTGNQVLQGFNDLASVYPDLAAEWSELNYPLYPSAVTIKANRKVWWRCRNCGQHWQARVADRTDGHGCPVCSGERLIPGINDFATEYPHLAQEWGDRNMDLKPFMVWSKSRRNVWWKCRNCGYEWRGVIDSRVKGQKCPACEKLARQADIPFHNVQEEHIFKTNAVAYYALLAGEPVLIDSEDIIGVPLDVYLPDKRASIVYSRPLVRDYRVRRENAKNWLCFNAGIRLFRILPRDGNEYDNCVCITLSDNTMNTLSAGLQVIFNMLDLHVDVDIVRDMKKIKLSPDKDRLISEISYN